MVFDRFEIPEIDVNPHEADEEPSFWDCSHHPEDRVSLGVEKDGTALVETFQCRCGEIITEVYADTDPTQTGLEIDES